MKLMLVLLLGYLSLAFGTDNKEHRYITIEPGEGIYRFQYGQHQILSGRMILDVYSYDEITFDYYDGDTIRGNLIQLKKNSESFHVIQFLFSSTSAFEAIERKLLAMSE